MGGGGTASTAPRLADPRKGTDMLEAMPDVLRTKRLEVYDDDNILRAVIRCSNDDPAEIEDAVFIELRDPKGNGLVYLIANRDGATMQWWGGGNDLMRFYAYRDGDAGVGLYNAESWRAVRVLSNSAAHEDDADDEDDE
jgi:hypothetical protein